MCILNERTLGPQEIRDTQGKEGNLSPGNEGFIPIRNQDLNQAIGQKRDKGYNM